MRLSLSARSVPVVREGTVRVPIGCDAIRLGRRTVEKFFARKACVRMVVADSHECPRDVSRSPHLSAVPGIPKETHAVSDNVAKPDRVTVPSREVIANNDVGRAVHVGLWRVEHEVRAVESFRVVRLEGGIEQSADLRKEILRARVY